VEFQIFKYKNIIKIIKRLLKENLYIKIKEKIKIKAILFENI